MICFKRKIISAMIQQPFRRADLSAPVSVRHKVFLPDNHYEMVQYHDWPDTLRIADRRTCLRLWSAWPDGIALEVAKTPLRMILGSTIPLEA